MEGERLSISKLAESCGAIARDLMTVRDSVLLAQTDRDRLIKENRKLKSQLAKHKKQCTCMLHGESK